MGTILRSEIMRRARTVWPMSGVPYSQSSLHNPDGYRADCSGYVSACWAIPLAGTWGGPNTVTMVADGWMHEIPADALREGDAVGWCGPGTAGDAGHVRLFLRWFNDNPNDNRHYVLEQSGGRSGPHESLVNWADGYRAYRFRDVVEDQAPAVTHPYPLTSGVYGLISDPRESVHGGYYEWEQPAVREIQRRLQQLRHAPAGSGWADGLYEQPTVDAVRAFQRFHGLQADGMVGPITWRALFG